MKALFMILAMVVSTSAFAESGEATAWETYRSPQQDSIDAAQRANMIRFLKAEGLEIYQTGKYILVKIGDVFEDAAVYLEQHGCKVTAGDDCTRSEMNVGGGQGG